MRTIQLRDLDLATDPLDDAVEVRKNFARSIDLLIDAGDVATAEPSTVVDPESADAPVVRGGAIPAARIAELLAGAGE